MVTVALEAGVVPKIKSGMALVAILILAMKVKKKGIIPSVVKG